MYICTYKTNTQTLHPPPHHHPQFDFYRKIPLDLTEATWHGGLVSVLALYVRLSVCLDVWLRGVTDSLTAVFAGLWVS